jgi:hypothetical protein
MRQVALECTVFDSDTAVRAYVVWLNDCVSTRVFATDWFEAVKLAIPRFGVEVEADGLLVTLDEETVRCRDLRTDRTFAVELAA